MLCLCIFSLGILICVCLIFREWSDEGCWVQASNMSHTVCACTHLTNFAVIMEVADVKVSVIIFNT